MFREVRLGQGTWLSVSHKRGDKRPRKPALSGAEGSGGAKLRNLVREVDSRFKKSLVVRALAVRAVLHQVQEGLMDAGIFREFGVEGRHHGFSLTDRNRVFSFGCDDFDARAKLLNLGSADEHHLEGCTLEQSFANGTVNLASVGIAADADIERTKPGLGRVRDLFGQQDRAGARAKRGLHPDKLTQLFHALFAKDAQKGAGLAAGN